MKSCKPFLKILISFAVVCLLVPTAHGAAIDVFLLTGQSNMDGRGKTTDLDVSLQQPHPSALIWYRNPPADSGGWKPLAPGYSIPPGHKDGLPGPTFGPEIGFANMLLAKNPKQLIGFIKGSKGGTSIEQWSPGKAGDIKSRGECYRHFMETLERAKNSLKEQGHSMTIRAVLWHQGESNAKDTTEEYQDKLINYINRIREDLALPEVPVFVGEVIDNGKRDAVRAAQKAVPGLMKHVYFVGVDGLTSHDKGVHFDSKSQLELGQRFAAAYLQQRQ